jgi:hypothetical protein
MEKWTQSEYWIISRIHNAGKMAGYVECSGEQAVESRLHRYNFKRYTILFKSFMVSGH